MQTYLGLEKQTENFMKIGWILSDLWHMAIHNQPLTLNWFAHFRGLEYFTVGGIKNTGNRMP